MDFESLKLSDWILYEAGDVEIHITAKGGSETDRQEILKAISKVLGKEELNIKYIDSSDQ